LTQVKCLKLNWPSHNRFRTLDNFSANCLLFVFAPHYLVFISMLSAQFEVNCFLHWFGTTNVLLDANLILPNIAIYYEKTLKITARFFVFDDFNTSSCDHKYSYGYMSRLHGEYDIFNIYIGGLLFLNTRMSLSPKS